MPGRSYTAIGAGKYRYGFNGKERDDEGLGGGQSTYDYGYRIYNPSLGRFLSTDPLTKSYPWFTPYQFSSNNPILFIDLDGLEGALTVNSPWFTGMILTAAIAPRQTASKIMDRVAELMNAALLASIPPGTNSNVFDGKPCAADLGPNGAHTGVKVGLHLGGGKYINVVLYSISVVDGKIVRNTPEQTQAMTQTASNNPANTELSTWDEFRNWLGVGVVLYGEGGGQASETQNALPGMKLISIYVGEIMELLQLQTAPGKGGGLPNKKTTITEQLNTGKRETTPMANANEKRAEAVDGGMEANLDCTDYLCANKNCRISNSDTLSSDHNKNSQKGHSPNVGSHGNDRTKQINVKCPGK